MVELLLGSGAKLDVRDGDGDYPLHWAAYAGHKEVVELLLSKGAAINAENSRGATALAYAFRRGRKAVVKRLVAKGAKIEFKGKDFLLDSEAPGFYRRADSGSQAWTEFMSWTYYDEEEKLILTIEQWGDDEFEATYGDVIEEYKISSILPKT